MTIEWGPIREHDGGAKCPAEARDVACAILDNDWMGLHGLAMGHEWGTWDSVTAYRLPADVPAPAPAADPVRDALVEALNDMLSGWIYIRSVHGDLSGVGWDRAQISAEQALALAKGETK